ncbi:hypothetical protein BDV95DRAFT_610374 [Massariosphaeria phaeospora]|uniref:Uncharacterized protein n=1 Tax=Massariosphaeria phaeospora TaxID=100035 RepID=A0A7C8M4D2_9PLEO|nr:hypothetical protein BDV95DRAFT_610374 [Massariosphaeria phaeospora]
MTQPSLSESVNLPIPVSSGSTAGIPDNGPSSALSISGATASRPMSVTSEPGRTQTSNDQGPPTILTLLPSSLPLPNSNTGISRTTVTTSRPQVQTTQSIPSSSPPRSNSDGSTQPVPTATPIVTPPDQHTPSGLQPLSTSSPFSEAVSPTSEPPIPTDTNGEQPPISTPLRDPDSSQTSELLELSRSTPTVTFVVTPPPGPTPDQPSTRIESSSSRRDASITTVLPSGEPEPGNGTPNTGGDPSHPLPTGDHWPDPWNPWPWPRSGDFGYDDYDWWWGDEEDDGEGNGDAQEDCSCEWNSASEEGHNNGGYWDFDSEDGSDYCCCCDWSSSEEDGWVEEPIPSPSPTVPKCPRETVTSTLYPPWYNPTAEPEPIWQDTAFVGNEKRDTAQNINSSRVATELDRVPRVVATLKTFWEHAWDWITPRNATKSPENDESHLEDGAAEWTYEEWLRSWIMRDRRPKGRLARFLRG